MANGEPVDLKFEPFDDAPAEVNADTPYVAPEAMAPDVEREARYTERVTERGSRGHDATNSRRGC